MASRGVHFAITSEQVAGFLTADGDEAVLALLGELETAWDEDNLAESDKAWDAMHRCLTNGTLEYGGGDYPLSHCVLGPRQLLEEDGNIICLVQTDEVPDVANALRVVSAEAFRQRYAELLPKNYSPEYGTEDQEQTWAKLQKVRDLFEKAAARRRAVVFAVDQ
ncbi:MAG: DUF1877 family protein [Polyangiaceae bacterium]